MRRGPSSLNDSHCRLHISILRNILLAGAVVVLPVAAFAQAPAAGQADCDRLIVILEQQKPANAPMTLDQARVYKRDNNVRGCQTALAFPTLAAAGQPGAAQITVQQSTPQVVVQQAQPSVTVNQAQPEVTVHQPAPTVTVDIPQPVITIRMPNPQVNVAMAQPQVEVTQAKPQVQVLQAGQPQVSIQQAAQQPNVTVQDSQQQPRVNYTSEQPKVVVNQQQGAPNVNFQQADQAAVAPVAVVGVVPVVAAPQGNDQQANSQGIAASRLMRMNVVNAKGDVLGDVEHVLIHAGDNKAHVVIGHGGFLGMGEKQLARPVENMFARDGKLVMRGMTDDQIRAMPSWRQGMPGYTDATSDQQVAVSTSG